MISWTRSEPTGTTIRVRARSSNDQTHWSTWENATNNALLHLKPAERYLEVMVTLTSTVKNVSPVLYDLTIISLSEAPINNADLGLTILTPTTEPTVNGTVRIVPHAGNNGPYDATSVHVNYRLPFGLEYQSTSSNYNQNTGLWTVGNLKSGTTSTLEIIARIINSGSLVNTGTIIGTEFDPNAANNQARLTFTVPNPAGEEQLPEVPANLPNNSEPTLPPIPNIEEGINLDPGVPLVSNTGSGNTGGSNGHGSGPGTVGGNDQLYRDQMYVRNYVGSPLTDPKINNPNGNNTDNNQTKPEMPGWEIDTSIFDALILAACMVASGLIGEELAKREFGGLYGKTTIKDLMQKGPVTPERIMIASFIATLLSPPTLKAEILMVTGLLVYFFTANGLTMAGKTNAYTILSLILFIISLAMLVSSIGKDAGKALKESVLGQLFELIKKFFN